MPASSGHWNVAVGRRPDQWPAGDHCPSPDRRREPARTGPDHIDEKLATALSTPSIVGISRRMLGGVRGQLVGPGHGFSGPARHQRGNVASEAGAQHRARIRWCRGRDAIRQPADHACPPFEHVRLDLHRRQLPIVHRAPLAGRRDRRSRRCRVLVPEHRDRVLGAGEPAQVVGIRRRRPDLGEHLDCAGEVAGLDVDLDETRQRVGPAVPPPVHLRDAAGQPWIAEPRHRRRRAEQRGVRRHTSIDVPARHTHQLGVAPRRRGHLEQPPTGQAAAQRGHRLPAPESRERRAACNDRAARRPLSRRSARAAPARRAVDPDDALDRARRRSARPAPRRRAPPRISASSPSPSPRGVRSSRATSARSRGSPAHHHRPPERLNVPSARPRWRIETRTAGTPRVQRHSSSDVASASGPPSTSSDGRVQLRPGELGDREVDQEPVAAELDEAVGQRASFELGHDQRDRPSGHRLDEGVRRALVEEVRIVDDEHGVRAPPRSAKLVGDPSDRPGAVRRARLVAEERREHPEGNRAQ